MYIILYPFVTQHLMPSPSLYHPPYPALSARAYALRRDSRTESIGAVDTRSFLRRCQALVLSLTQALEPGVSAGPGSRIDRLS